MKNSFNFVFISIVILISSVAFASENKSGFCLVAGQTMLAVDSGLPSKFCVTQLTVDSLQQEITVRGDFVNGTFKFTKTGDIDSGYVKPGIAATANIFYETVGGGCTQFESRLIKLNFGIGPFGKIQYIQSVEGIYSSYEDECHLLGQKSAQIEYFLEVIED